MTTAETPVEQGVIESPFPGLTHYTSDYADVFFGRDSERKRIVGNLQASRLTLLYAQSGVGKSSLLSAGVAPRLVELARISVEDEGAPGYIPVVMREWVGDPVERLVETIRAAVEPFVSGDRELALTPDDLEAAIEEATARTDATVLVILDQFEEYFNYHATGAGATFADRLAACINRPDLRANFLISIREDAYSRIGDLLKSRIPSVYGNYLHLEYLDREALEDSITCSIEEYDRLYAAGDPVRAESGLVSTVLDEVSTARQAQNDPAGESTQIDAAFVQLVMKRLWKEELAASSRILRRATLDRLGGAREIIRTHLDEAMATLSEDDQDTAALAFRYLVTPDLAKVALGTNALSEWTEIPEARIENVLRALSAQDMKILRPVLDAQSDGRRYEIFHDGLAEPILSWRTRHGDPEIRKAQQEAAEAARREARERKLRYVAVGAFVVALCIAGFAAFEYFRAKSANTAATEATARATSVDLAFRVPALAGQPDFGPRAAAVVGLEAYHAWPTFEARNQVLSFLQGNPGLTTLTVPTANGIRDIAFLPNATVATIGFDGSLRTTTVGASAPMTAHTVRPPQSGPSSSVDFTSLAVDPSGRLLAIGRSDGAIEVFATSDPQRPLRTFSVSRPSEVRALSFSPSGELAAGDDRGRVWMFPSATSSKPRAPAFTVGQSVRELSFCPSSAGPKCVGLLAAAAGNGTWLWDPENPHRPAERTAVASLGAAWAPDGSIAIAVDSPASPGIRLVPRKGAPRFIATADLVNSLTFADGGKVLAAGGDDGAVTTWDVATGRSFGPPRTESGGDAVDSIAVSDAGMLAAGGNAGLSLWPLDAPRALATTVGSLGYANEEAPVEIWGLAVGSSGEVAAATNRGVLLWRDPAADAARVPQTPTIISGDDSLAVAFHGDTLASAHSGSITLWNAASCDRSGKLATDCLLGSVNAGSRHDIYSLTFDGTGDLVAAGTFDGRVMVWDVTNPRKPKPKGVLLKEPNAIYSLAFSPTDDLLAVAGKDGTIQLWSVPGTGKPMRVQVLRGPHGDQAVDSLVFSPDGTLLASGGDDQQVILWHVDPTNGLTRVRSATQTGSNSILAVAFSPGDGATLATGDDNGRACLYDTGSLQPLGSSDCLLGHSAAHASRTGLWGVAFTLDGQALLTGGIDNPVVAWSSVLWSNSRKDIDAAYCTFALPPLSESQWSSAFYGTPLAHRASTTRCR